MGELLGIILLLIASLVGFMFWIGSEEKDCKVVCGSKREFMYEFNHYSANRCYCRVPGQDWKMEKF